MKEFTVIKKYVVSEWGVESLAVDFEKAINDYIECNWAGIDKASEVPLEIRQQILRHVVDEMLDPDSEYTWDE